MISATDVQRKAARVIRFLASPRTFFESDFQEDGLAVQGKNLGFLDNPAFKKAWEKARLLNMEGWKNTVPEIRWRVYIACWAVNHSLRVSSDGDLAEFGVHTGLTSLMLCQMTDFAQRGRTLYLFDTFKGIPILDSMGDVDRERAKRMNVSVYSDCYQLAQRNFEEYPNVTLVRGILPDTLNNVKIASLCFAHFDLNNAPSEMKVINRVWDQIVPGGIILLDDYGWTGYEPQYEAWNEFCRRVDHPVLTLPTGQGLIVKAPA